METLEENIMRQHILTEFNEAYNILSLLHNGQDIDDKNINDMKHIDDLILKMLNFRQYTNMFKYAFLNWELIFDDQNEQTYLDLAEKTKLSLTLLTHDVFKETLASLLIIKSNHENKTIEEINDNYMKKIGEMWKTAGLIR